MQDINDLTEQVESPTFMSLVPSWCTIATLATVAAFYTIFHNQDRNAYIPSNIETASDFESDIARETINALRSLQEKFTYDDHAPLLPLTSSDYIGFLCAICGLMVAAGGGIGGGGILVPIYILVMGFSPKHAIPLSNITVFGGAVANTVLNAKKRHPLADRPMVDWDLILIMEPLTIAGALMGAFLNKLLREEVLVVMLVLLLSFTAHNTLKQAIKMYKLETVHRDRNRLKESELATMKMDNLIDAEVEAEDELLGNTEDEEIMEDVEINDELRQILEEEKVVPMQNIYILMMVFVTILTVNVLKGGGAFHSPLGIKCGGTGFWVANIFMLILIVGISIWVKRYLMEKHERKVRCGFKYVEGDIKWDDHATTWYPLICTLAGFFAGMFGVGGGIVKGPLMLAMGVHPKVSSASSACMILFTSFTATSSFIVFGLLVYDYAFICLLVGYFATYVGQIVLYYLMNKYERNSYIAFSIGGVVLLSALLMTVQSLVSMAEHGAKEPEGICKGS
jgi:uncharacterized membrane protein YfcA